MSRRHLKKLALSAVLLAVAAASLARPARACDIKIHEAAYKQWPREYYLLYMVYNNQNKLSDERVALAKKLREELLSEVNADVIKLNLDGSMLREDREFLSGQGCGGWPQMAILDKDGKILARASGKLGKRELRYLSERVGEAPGVDYKDTEEMLKGARAVVLYLKSNPESLAEAEKVTAEALAEADFGEIPLERLDAEDPANKALADKLRPAGMPVMYLVSPRGHLLATFPGDISEADLVKTFDSPARQKLTKVLEKNAMAFVFVSGEDKKANEAFLARLKPDVAKSEKLCELDLEIVEVDATDPLEKLFVKNMYVEKAPVVVPVFGKGKHLEPLAEFTEDDIIGRAQFMLQNCTCVLNPSALGEDLMLLWKGVDELMGDE